MKRLIFLTFMALVFLGNLSETLFAETPQEMFFKANKSYSNGDYASAAHHYEEILATGLRGGNLYYNLGNAYFKLGRKGKAIVNYLRAQQEMPQDGDVFTNLNFTYSLLEEAQIEEQRRWVEKLYLAVRDFLGPGAWFLCSAAAFLTICILLGVALWNPAFQGWSRPVLFLLGFCFLLSLAFFFSSADDEKNSRLAVMTDPHVEVLYSPSYSGAVAFELHEGIKVSAVRTEGDWTQIRLTRDKSGWVPSNSLEKV